MTDMIMNHHSFHNETLSMKTSTWYCIKAALKIKHICGKKIKRALTADGSDWSYVSNSDTCTVRISSCQWHVTRRCFFPRWTCSFHIVKQKKHKTTDTSASMIQQWPVVNRLVTVHDYEAASQSYRQFTSSIHTDSSIHLVQCCSKFSSFSPSPNLLGKTINFSQTLVQIMHSKHH